MLDEKKKSRYLMGSFVMLLGFASALIFISAGTSLYDAGQDLTTLRTVGGKSAAESYYQSMGSYGIAYAQICYAAALCSLAISLGIGRLLTRAS
tara:strand:+ start:64 stop:345 length:282 start_codon:yes stop_codon:yes gene_type:complete